MVREQKYGSKDQPDSKHDCFRETGEDVRIGEKRKYWSKDQQDSKPFGL